ncbi:MAG: tRNA preQ1(34) S-adenosylmethionine ribosyltransferase-isomerase QueA [Candidatus Sumerlaeota bacterium]
MRTDLFDYYLPEELIARHPAPERVLSRLLHLPRDPAKPLKHLQFSDFPALLRDDDLLVINDSKVLPARLLGHRAPGGGKVEALLVRPEDERRWWAMVRPGKRIKASARLIFERGLLEAHVEDYGPPGSGERLLRFESPENLEEVLSRIGHTPLPPYILRARKQDSGSDDSVPEEDGDRERYQTVYAQGPARSVAAPTAGLHFNNEMLENLGKRGIEITRIQLHVGPGTFQPITTEEAEEHPMHKEWIQLSRETAHAVNRAKQEGRRVVAVGTTVVRTLETAALVARGEADKLFDPEEPTDIQNGLHVSPLAGWTRLMISPGHNFRCIDALLTNFHLPRSSLLLLVSAFVSRERMLDAYNEAIKEGYRFYSYGDCMFID